MSGHRDHVCVERHRCLDDFLRRVMGPFDVCTHDGPGEALGGDTLEFFGRFNADALHGRAVVFNHPWELRVGDRAGRDDRGGEIGDFSDYIGRPSADGIWVKNLQEMKFSGGQRR